MIKDLFQEIGDFSQSIYPPPLDCGIDLDLLTRRRPSTVEGEFTLQYDFSVTTEQQAIAEKITAITRQIYTQTPLGYIFYELLPTDDPHMMEAVYKRVKG